MANLTDSRPFVNAGATKTVAQTDEGIVQQAVIDGTVFTLPAAAAGLVGVEFTFRNGGAPITNGPVGTGADGSVGFTIAPNAADGVNGLGFTSAVNKGVVNTKATSLVGDEITLVCSGVTGVNAWNVIRSRGIFARVP